MSLAISQSSRRNAHRRASKSPIAEVAAEVQNTLGASLTTVALGLRDPKAIGQWAKGTRQPRPPQDAALRALYQVVSILSEVEQPDVIRAWFAGMNPDLDDRSPALVFRDDPAAVLHAAESFVVNG